MNRLVVGADNCSIKKIVACIFNAVPAEQLISEWPLLSRGLDTHPNKRKEWQTRSLTLGIVLDILEDVIDDWRVRNGDNAKLTHLMSIIENINRAHWRDAKEKLWESFHGTFEDGTSWNDLDKKTQFKILHSQVQFLGNVVSLQKCFKGINDERIHSIMERYTTTRDLVLLLSNQVTILAKNVVPEVPKYYQARFIYPRNRLDTQIFRHQSEDVFIVSGASLIELNKIAAGQPVGRPVGEIHTLRFIHSDDPGDFAKITQRISHNTVHLLRKTETGYEWVMTQGSIKLIQKYCRPATKSLGSANFVSLKDEFACIAGKPGQGKTTLLAHMCRSVSSSSRDSLALYFKFSEILFLGVSSILDSKTVARQIANKVGSSSLGREIVFEILSSDKKKSAFFIDDFDEVDLGLDESKKIISCLPKLCKSFSIFICTRIHKRVELEESFTSISYGIRPFDLLEHANMLYRFWHHTSQFMVEANKLSDKSKDVATSAKDHMFPEDFGDPTICTMLGEVCRNDWCLSASNAAKTVCMMSKMHEMSRVFADSCLARVDLEYRKQIKLMHLLAGIQMLFPKHENEFQVLFDISNVTVNPEEIFRVGMVQEKNKAGYLLTHRMHADYIITSLVASTISDSNILRQSFAWKLLLDALECKQDGEGIRVHTYDCYAREVCRLLQKCNASSALNSGWMELASMLGLSINDTLTIKRSQQSAEQEDEDAIFQVLYRWTSDLTASPPLEQLVQCLLSLEFHDAADILKQRYYKMRFTNLLFASFVNKNLDSIDINETHQLHSANNLSRLDPESLYLILRCCVFHDLFFLFKLFGNAYHNMTNPLSYYVQDKRWSVLICDAAKYSSSQLVTECAIFVERVTGKSIWELEYTTWAGAYLTPLHAALQRGNHSVFQELFNSYKSHLPNVICDLKLLLHCCTIHSIDNDESIINNKIQMIEDILHFNADSIKETDPWFGRTPLIMDRVHYKIAMHLLESNADATATDTKWKHTVAHRAGMYYKWKEFCQLASKIVQNNSAQVLNMTNWKSLTPLAVALQKINIKPSEFLYAPVSLLPARPLKNELDSLLYSAIVGLQEVSIYSKLVGYGANPLGTWDDGKTYVHVSAEYGNVGALKFFTSGPHGCNVNARDKKGLTPLLTALKHCVHNTCQVIKTLLELKADATAADNLNRSAISYALSAYEEKRIDEITYALLNQAYISGTNEPITHGSAQCTCF